jgi:hypothetical protein
MAGFISQMFPEFGDSLPGKAVGMLGRGVQSIASAPIDLASLPFTMTGMIKPEDAVGSTAWFDKKGLFLSKEKGNNAYEQALLDSVELIPALAAPAQLGGMVGASKAAQKLPSRVSNLGREGADEIPTTLGQRNQDVVKMNQAARLAAEEKFAQRIADFGKYQNDKAGRIIDGFARSIADKSTSADLGKRIQYNFETWFDGVKATYKDRTDAAYNKALNHPGASKPLPLSVDSWAHVVSFATKNLKDNSPPELKAAITDLLAKENVINNPRLTVQELRQHMEQANNLFSQNALKAGPYDTVNAGSLSRIQTVYKEALQKRLDHAIANAPDADVVESAAALKRADKLYGIAQENQKFLQKQSVNKFLGAREDEILNPEAIANHFKKLSPTQQNFFTKVANKVDPDMVPAMRKHIFDDLYTSGLTKGAGSADAGFDMRQFLSKVDDLKNKNPAMLNFVLGDDPAMRERFEATVANMRDAINTGPTVSSGSSVGAANMAAGAAGALVNQPGAARAGAGLIQAIREVGVNKEQLFEHLFNGGPVPDPAAVTVMKKAGEKGGKALDALDDVTGFGPPSAGAGLRQGTNMEAAEQINEAIQGQEPQIPTDAVTPLGGDIDPALLEGWDAAPVAPSSPVPAPPEGGVDPALLEGW